VQLQRAFRHTDAPFILPPDTSRDQIEILKEAFRKTHPDAHLGKHFSPKEHKRLTGEEPTPLMPKDLQPRLSEDSWKKFPNGVSLLGKALNRRRNDAQ
jgi:hypothetical protein